MATIVNNSSNTQGDPTEEAIKAALKDMDLSKVMDSNTAARYAVSSVDQNGQPTLKGAVIGGNTGTIPGSQPINFVGQDSIHASTTANLILASLVNDVASPAAENYYGTDGTGLRGYHDLPVSVGRVVTAFAFGDASPMVLYTPTDGRLMFVVRIVITQTFNGTGAALQVGTSGSPGSMIGIGDNDPSQLQAYETGPNVTVPAATPVLLTITPGTGATQGTGLVVLDAYRQS